MKFKCRPVEIDFLEGAPVQFVNEVELDASPAQVFTIFEDAEAWPHWYQEIVKVEWNSLKPYGVGTTRTVQLTTMTVEEYFFLWEQNKRFAFYFTEMGLPLAHALVEDYWLENLGGDRSKLIYTVCFEPTLWIRLGGSLALKFYKNMFHQATQNLATYIQEKKVAA